MTQLIYTVVLFVGTLCAPLIVDIIILAMQIHELERCVYWDDERLTFVDEDGIDYMEAANFGRLSGIE